jgi:hypothetical protein
MELQLIQNKIFEIRGQKVMLDFHLAEMYDVETKVLNQSVKRNIKRFPGDFMFQLTNNEYDNLRSQIVTSSWGGARTLPYAFTEHGVTMLAGVLRSDKAIQINLQIVRTFIALRQFALGYVELNRKIEEFMISTNMQFNDIYQALTELASQKELDNKPRNPIGYIKNEE